MRKAVLLLAALFLAPSARAQETDLDRTLLAARRDTSQMVRFYSEFVGALLYVPTASGRTDSLPESAGTLRLALADSAGVSYAVAFDRRDRLHAWADGDVPHRAVAGSSVIGAVAAEHPGVALVLNPGTPFARTFTPKEIAWLNKSLNAPQEAARVARDTEVYVGGPAYAVPDALLDALVASLKEQRDVKEAHLSQFTMAEGRSGLLLTLTLDRDAPARLSAIRSAVEAAVSGILPETMLLSVGLHARRGLTEHTRETGRLIYVRSAGQ